VGQARRAPWPFGGGIVPERCGIARETALAHIEGMLPGGRFWTVPNILSLSRLVLLPVFFYAIARPHLYGLAAFLVAYSIVSDLLDGYLARRFGQVSDWGRLLDPLADKVTIAAGLLFCYFERGLPFWVLLAIVGRDLLILLLAPLVAHRVGRLPRSNLPGRLAALSFAILAAVYILKIEMLQAPLTIVSLVLLVLSTTVYTRRLFAYAPDTEGS